MNSAELKRELQLRRAAYRQEVCAARSGIVRAFVLVGLTSLGLTCGGGDSKMTAPVDDIPPIVPSPIATEEVRIQVAEATRDAVATMMVRKWAFSSGRQQATNPVIERHAPSVLGLSRQVRPVGDACQRQETTPLGASTAYYYSDAVGHNLMTIISTPSGGYRAYLIGWDKRLLAADTKCCDVEMDVWTMTATDPSDFKNWSVPTRLLTDAPWSLTAALAPGGHHVRLYLESEGKLTTMLSKKGNFVEFLEPGTKCRDVSAGVPTENAPAIPCGPDIGEVVFQDTADRPLTSIIPRDPNVSQNSAGVYVMTWDNRDPNIRPESTADTTAASSTFGLAFSADGLVWTVYSDGLKIEGLAGTGSGTAQCSVGNTGEVRHVVPVFITNEKLQLYFISKQRTGGLGPDCPAPGQTACSLGTAISN